MVTGGYSGPKKWPYKTGEKEKEENRRDTGRVKNHQKLYVIDGALIPGCCAGSNPAMTISALTERNMENILENDFWFISFLLYLLHGKVNI